MADVINFKPSSTLVKVDRKSTNQAPTLLVQIEVEREVSKENEIVYCARPPFRDICSEGKTPEKATANLLRWVAELIDDGALHLYEL